jgi:hypothetical protein
MGSVGVWQVAKLTYKPLWGYLPDGDAGLPAEPSGSGLLCERLGGTPGLSGSLYRPTALWGMQWGMADAASGSLGFGSGLAGRVGGGTDSSLGTAHGNKTTALKNGRMGRKTSGAR